ncbi:MAG: hypothetical protein FD129_284 [bacterium]|nr:MAG: hypothetical protein FD129_284 [bacterium]
MSRTMRFSLLAAAMTLASISALAQKPMPPPDWSMNATIIEACSCPMFCQCYFATEPAAHHDMSGMSHGGEASHYCKFNNAFQVNKGSYGDVKLDGAKFWVYGDLGGDFSKGQMDWGVVTFDKSLTPAQREGIAAILGHLYPVTWNSLTTAEGMMEWVAGPEESYATLDGGKSAEVRLSTKTLNRNMGGKPMVMENLKYWGAPRNDGFVMMPNTVEAVRTGAKPFEFKGTNGFMITVDITSKDVSAPGKG